MVPAERVPRVEVELATTKRATPAASGRKVWVGWKPLTV